MFSLPRSSDAQRSRSPGGPWRGQDPPRQITTRQSWPEDEEEPEEFEGVLGAVVVLGVGAGVGVEAVERPVPVEELVEVPVLGADVPVGRGVVGTLSGRVADRAVWGAEVWDCCWGT
jgi:hypothetical protein